MRRLVDIWEMSTRRLIDVYETGRASGILPIYHSLVESHLNYTIVTWTSSFSRNFTDLFISEHIPDGLKAIKSTQNKVMRAIFRKPRFDKSLQSYTSNTPLYKELKVLKLFDLYCFNLACLAHEFFFEKNLPEKIAENFT